MGRRVLVCGGRYFGHRPEDRALFLDAMGLYAGTPEVVIHGCARGADTLADDWAIERTVPVLRFPADWVAHGKRAGPMRNAEMLARGKPDVVIAFPGNDGTADMVAKARRVGVSVVEVRP